MLQPSLVWYGTSRRSFRRPIPVVAIRRFASPEAVLLAQVLPTAWIAPRVQALVRGGCQEAVSPLVAEGLPSVLAEAPGGVQYWFHPVPLRRTAGWKEGRMAVLQWSLRMRVRRQGIRCAAVHPRLRWPWRTGRRHAQHHAALRAMLLARPIINTLGRTTRAACTRTCMRAHTHAYMRALSAVPDSTSVARRTAAQPRE